MFEQVKLNKKIYQDLFNNFNNRISSIYLISTTESSKVYIGQTWTGMMNRFTHHKFDKKADCPKLFNALNKYDRKTFSVKTVAFCWSQKDADFCEDFFIKHHNSIKNGYNIRNGGGRGKHSQETLQKYFLKDKNHFFGKTHTNEFKKKLSEMRSGNNNPMFGKSGELSPTWGLKFSAETRAKMSASKKGKTLSEETRKKLSIINKGKKVNDETRAKLSVAQKIRMQNIPKEQISGENNGMFGKKHTLKARQKMSITRKGRVNSQSTIDKVSKANTGRSFSEETRKKMSESAKLRRLRDKELGKKFPGAGKKPTQESIMLGNIGRNKYNKRKILLNKINKLIIFTDTNYNIIFNNLCKFYWIEKPFRSNLFKKEQVIFNNRLDKLKLFSYSFDQIVFLKELFIKNLINKRNNTGDMCSYDNFYNYSNMM